MSEKAFKSRNASKSVEGMDHVVDIQIGNERKGLGRAMDGGDVDENDGFQYWKCVLH